jgi:ribonucleotide monophosphatase NagD (HAD superfamily)
MIGDSLDHDILGGHIMGWDTLFVQSGIHAADFVNGEHRTILEKIIHQKKCRPPTYMMDLLK